MFSLSLLMFLMLPHFCVQILTLHTCHHALFTQPAPFSKLSPWLSTPEAALTDYFNFVCCIDFSNFVKHPAGVFPTVLWLQVLQVQRPLLLLVLPNLLGREGLIVLQPHDVRPRVPAGHALQADGAADGTGDHSPSHLGRLREPGPGCKRHEKWTVVSKGRAKKGYYCQVLWPNLLERHLAAPYIPVYHSRISSDWFP